MATLAWPCSGFLGKNMPTASVGMAPNSSYLLTTDRALYGLDVLGTRAFLPPAFRVGHLLAFAQFLETDTLEAR